MKRNAYIGVLLKSTAIACLILGYVSCVDDDEVASLQNTLKTEVLTFDINYSKNWLPDVIDGSKSTTTGRTASSRSTALLMDCDQSIQEGNIYMYMVEEDCPAMLDTTQIDSRNAASENSSLSSVGVFAFHTTGEGENQSTSLFMDNINLSTYGTDTNPYKYWPGKGKLNFFAYSPHSNNVTGLNLINQSNQVEVRYTVPINVDEQSDLLLGISDEYDGNSLTDVDINISHVLSCIQVKAGTMMEGVIKSVRFTNIYSTGSKSGLNGWSTTNDTTHYEQRWDKGLPIPGGDDKAIGSPMYLMPQKLDKDAQIIIEMTVTSTDPDTNNSRSHDYTLTKKLVDFTTEWSPNKIYTFVISTPEEVEIEVSDSVSGNKKENLSIRNTGLGSCYIRAAIVGNWVIPNETETYDDDIVVAGWSFDDGYGTMAWGSHNNNIEPSSTATTGWRKHTDGYYYHLNPVASGKETAKLFESYTLGSSSPQAGAVLDLTIVAQAVLVDDVNLAWPKEITSQFVQTTFLSE